MKTKIKNCLFWVLSVSFLYFTSCETEKDFLTKSIDNTQFKVKKISYSALKSNQNAFQTLKESHLIKYPNVQYRGVYNPNYGVFVDTTNIVVVQNGDKHSITLKIIDEQSTNEIENLVLNSNGNGEYTAYTTKYILTNQEMQTLEDGQRITDKQPTSITRLDNGDSLIVSQSSCVDIHTSTGYNCFNASGEVISSNGELNDGCVGGGWQVINYVVSINFNCGGSSHGTGSSSGNLGGVYTGGGSSGSNNNNPPNNVVVNIRPDVPIFTTPVLNVRAFAIFYASLNANQLNWWNNQATDEIRNSIKDYVNQYPNKEVAFAFANELINIINNNGYDPSAGSNNTNTTPPDCQSFNFSNSSAPNWQESAVANIHFNVVLVSQQGIYLNHAVAFTQPILFGAPKNLLIGNTTITPGMAASLSAQALLISMNETVQKYGNKPVSDMIVRLYFESRLKHNYPLLIPGGRVNIHPQNLNVVPTQYQTNLIGTGNCY